MFEVGREYEVQSSKIYTDISISHAALLILVPDDNVALAAVKYGGAAILGGVALTFFAGGFVIAALQED